MIVSAFTLRMRCLLLSERILPSLACTAAAADSSMKWCERLLRLHTAKFAAARATTATLSSGGDDAG
jgi:hypothetical protein